MIKTPRELHLPYPQWRVGQWEAIEEIIAYPGKFFLLDAPPGTGKSGIGVAVHQAKIPDKLSERVLARITGDDQPPDARCLYLTRTKQLQEQVTHDFPRARTIKGRKNYPCAMFPGRFPEMTAEDCRGSKDCAFGTCAYKIAKSLAVTASIAVLNTAYYLTEANGPGQFSHCSLLVVDEVDSLESALTDYIQFHVSEKQVGKYGVSLPKDKDSLTSWLNWAAQINLTGQIMEMKDSLGEEANWSDIEIGIFRRIVQAERFEAKAKMFAELVNETWLMVEGLDKNNSRTWTFKPVVVGDLADRFIWRHADKVLGMSGTILNPKIVGEDIGIREHAYHVMQSQFPVEHRPIYYHPVVNLTQTTMAEELPYLAQEVGKTIDRYPDVKGLIHTASYQVRDFLIQNPKYFSHRGFERIITHESHNREEQLAKFENSMEPLVMVSPSFDRGINLSDDLCRFIGICKVPYLNMGDNQVKARMKMPGGQQWYLMKAIQTVMQMSGRAVRSPMDFSDTFIWDKQFMMLLNRTRHMIPKWWLDSLHFGDKR